METRSVEPRRSSVPLAAWLLLLAAVATLVPFMVRDWYQIFGPYFIIGPERIIQALAAITPLLVAAGVVIGGARWPAGARWLAWGAGAFATYGILDASFEAWLVWWEPSPGPLDPATNALFFGRAWISLVASVAGPVLLAAGLWAVAPPAARRTFGRTAALAAIASIAVAGIAAGVLFAASEFRLTSSWGLSGVDSLFGAIYGLSPGVVGAAMAVLAIGALRAMPSGGAMPELVITSGASLAAAAAAWTTAAQFLWGQDALAEQAWLAFVVPGGVAAAGMLLVAAGFALGAVTGRGSGST